MLKPVPPRFLRWFAAALALAAAGCPSPPPRPLLGVPAGVWKGQTSQGRPIEVTVTNGGVATVKAGFHLLLVSPCTPPGSRSASNYRGGLAQAVFDPPLAIAGGLFVARASFGDVDALVKGTFTSANLTGTVDVRPAPSSGCTGGDSFAYTAHEAPPGS